MHDLPEMISVVALIALERSRRVYESGDRNRHENKPFH